VTLIKEEKRNSMTKSIENRLERIERRLGEQDAPALFPDPDRPGEFIEMDAKAFADLIMSGSLGSRDKLINEV
jgi:hypothetical protein